MGVHSGMWGVINGKSTVRNWTINKTSDNKAYVASNTRGGTGRRRGNIDWTGNYNAYGGTPGAMPGEAFSFTGYTSPTNDTEGAVGTNYQGTSIVENVTINWNWETADIISHVVNFAGNGQLNQASDSLYSDATDPDAPSIIGCEVRIQNITNAASGVVTLDNVVSATLNMTAANKPYVNSSTGGYTLRKRGPFDWNLQLVCQDDDLGAMIMDINDEVVVEIDVEAGGDYWSLSYGLVKEWQGVTVDRETGNIIQATIPIEMCAFSHVDEAIGAVLLPGGATYWPYT